MKPHAPITVIVGLALSASAIAQCTQGTGTFYCCNKITQGKLAQSLLAGIFAIGQDFGLMSTSKEKAQLEALVDVGFACESAPECLEK